MVHAGGSDRLPASGYSCPSNSAKSDDLPLPLAPPMPTFWPTWSASAAPSSRRLAPRASVRSTRRIMRANGNQRRRRKRPGEGRERRSRELVIVVDDERRVIGEAPVLVDRDRTGLRGDARRRHLVIDAPADVLLPRLPARRPERVLLGLLVDGAEDVDEADLVEYPREPGAFLGQKAGDLLIRASVPEVDRLVRDVPVAAQ